MASYEVEERWGRWAGTLAELREAGEMAVGVIRDWTGKDPQIAVTVVERTGRTVRLEDLAELPAAVDPRDLAGISAITVELGRYSDARVEIRLDGGRMGEGMRLAIRGDDRTRVEGLARRLADVLKPRHTLGLPALYGIRGMMIGLAVWAAVLFTAGLVVRYGFSLGRAERLAVSFGSATLAVLGVLLLWEASPTVEVLAPGQQPRFRRWRAIVVAVIVTIVLGVASSIIATALYADRLRPAACARRRHSPPAGPGADRPEAGKPH